MMLVLVGTNKDSCPKPADPPPRQWAPLINNINGRRRTHSPPPAACAQIPHNEEDTLFFKENNYVFISTSTF